MKFTIKQLITLLFCSSFLLFASQAHAEIDCAIPAPPIIPDGNVASEDELIAAQKALKTFQASLVDYRNCLADVQEALKVEVGEGEKSALVIDKEKALVDAYNDSVTHEETAANEFNTAVRAFKARQ